MIVVFIKVCVYVYGIISKIVDFADGTNSCTTIKLMSVTTKGIGRGHSNEVNPFRRYTKLGLVSF